MTILNQIIGHLQDNPGQPLQQRVYAAQTFLINALKFKLLNINSKANEIRFTTEFKLRVHEKAYYAFRYFTDFDNAMAEELRSFLNLTQGYRYLIDVGAHYGIFSLAFARLPGTVAYALEPSPAAFDILNQHIGMNSGYAVQAFPIAVSAVDQAISLYAGASDHVVVAPGQGDCITVDAMTLDGFVATQAMTPDVIKIDVEGYEIEVLRGATQVLTDCDPLIFLEIHPQELMELGSSVVDVVHLLQAFNYQFFNHRNHRIAVNQLRTLNQVTRVICRKERSRL